MTELEKRLDEIDADFKFDSTYCGLFTTKLMAAIRKLIDQRNDALRLAWDDVIPIDILEQDNQELLEILR